MWKPTVTPDKEQNNNSMEYKPVVTAALLHLSGYVKALTALKINTLVKEMFCLFTSSSVSWLCGHCRVEVESRSETISKSIAHTKITQSWIKIGKISLQG